MMATRQGGRVLAPTLLALSGLAWLTLVLWGQSPYGRYLDHQQIDGGGGALVLPVFVLAWLLMMVAMMLPTSLPLVRLFDTITRRRTDHRRLVLLLLVGYLGVWGRVRHRHPRPRRGAACTGAPEWLARRARVADRPGRARAGRRVPVHTAQVPLPGQVPLAVELHHRTLARQA